MTGGASAAGIEVNEKSALKFAPVYAAVKRISESIASLPLNLYRINGKSKEKATDLPLYRVLHLQPNQEETRMQMWESLVSHLLLWGNAYAQIERSLGGEIIALWPLDPSRMTPKRNNSGLLVYEYRLTDSGQTITFPFWDILHIAGLSYNGLIGYSVLSFMRDSIGLGLAQEDFESKFYSNGAHPGGVLESDQPIGDETIEQLKNQFMASYGGVTNSQKMLVLQQGLKFKPLTLPQKDAQALEGRQFSVQDVARWFLIPPHMIGDLGRATWGNIESQSIDYVVYTLRPWLVRIEQAMETRFGLTEEFEIRHSVEGLLRGDSAARATFYQSAITNGWLSRNEVRELEDRNPEPGLDEFLSPMNMSGKEEEAEPKSDKKEEKEETPIVEKKESEIKDVVRLVEQALKQIAGFPPGTQFRENKIREIGKRKKEGD